MLKYIFTLGPASTDEKIILSFLDIADRLRLNTSHISHAGLRNWLTRLDGIFTESGKRIPVIIDLQGSKMRIGQYPSVNSIPKNVSLIYENVSNSAELIPVPHKDLFQVLKRGDIINLNDAKLLLKIKTVVNNKATAETISNGPLSSYKGINRKKHPIPFKELTEKDIGMINIAMEYGFTEFAFSFTYNGKEADKIRPFTKEHRLIAKIERPETFDHISSIDSAFDELWLCRGDLAAQAGIFQLGYLQNSFSSKISELKRKCFLAGQVLEHMTHFKEPTRSEIVHLYDIEKNGFAGIVLSDETAIGKNPISIVNFLKTLK